MSTPTPTLPWPTSDGDPVDERICNDVCRVLMGVSALSMDGTPKPLQVRRAQTQAGSIGTEDLETVVWFDDPQKAPAPYGQAGWRAVFEVTVYVREDEKGLPIDRRLSLARAAVADALMADPRRSGLCVVDCDWADKTPVIFLDGGESGVSSVRQYLACEYRTVRGDSTRLAPSAGNEVLDQGGGVLLFAPDGGGRPARFADLRVTLAVEPMAEDVADDTSGPGRVADVVVTGHRTRYDLEGENLNAQMLAWQMGGGPVTAYGRSSAPLVAVPHAVGGPDSVVMLHDANGGPVLPLASVDVVTSTAGPGGTTTYAAGADYLVDPDCLAEGIIKIPANSTISAGFVLVGMTPVAVTGRPTFDVAAGCGVRGTARLVWRDAGGRTRVHGDFRASIVAQSAPDPQPGRPTTTKYTLTVLDGGQATAGRVLMPAGSVPAAGF